MTDTAKKPKTKSELATQKALDEFEIIAKQAGKEIDEFQTRQEFEMIKEVEDKEGQLTKVLVVDIDAVGVLSKQARHGNPHKVDTSTGETQCNDDLLFAYFNLMSNVDIQDEKVLAAMGRKTLQKARAMVAGFFILLLVSEFDGVSETEN